ncbi:MAG TPA: HDOD domain-containing protein [Candidatus Eisenbacteria bacterium]|nr:HDOD domain-containing protein [Candidatus Eisenbacteria bacterium]
MIPIRTNTTQAPASRVLDRTALRQVTEGMVALPTLPLVASRLLEAVKPPQASATEIGRILSLDPALTARTLRLANSEFYGFPRKVGSVDLAVVVLGSNTIRDLVLSASVFQTLGEQDAEMEGLWSHSLACAVAARTLAERNGYRLSSEAYAAGLLHDIGTVVLRQTDPGRFHAVIAMVRDQGEDVEEAERGLFGSCHAEVGAWLAERWGLPADLVEAIACHHRPENATRNPELAFLVHVANSLAERAGFVWPRGVATRPLTPSAWELVESDGRRREALLQTLVEDVVRETERERDLFAEFRGSQEE